MRGRRQTNVSLPAAVVEKMLPFAKVFHRGEFAPVARILIEEGLRHVSTDEEYLKAMQRSAGYEGSGLEPTDGKSTRRK